MDGYLFGDREGTCTHPFPLFSCFGLLVIMIISFVLVIIMYTSYWWRTFFRIEYNPSEARVWVVSSGTENTVFSWSVWRRLALHEVGCLPFLSHPLLLLLLLLQSITHVNFPLQNHHPSFIHEQRYSIIVFANRPVGASHPRWLSTPSLPPILNRPWRKTTLPNYRCTQPYDAGPAPRW